MTSLLAIDITIIAVTISIKEKSRQGYEQLHHSSLAMKEDIKLLT